MVVAVLSVCVCLVLVPLALSFCHWSLEQLLLVVDDVVVFRQSQKNSWSAS